MINVTVKFFGPLRDTMQRDELSLDVSPPYTGERVFDVLEALSPRIHEWKTSVRLAVNLEYAPLDRLLKNGDEISFIPPVSGG